MNNSEFYDVVAELRKSGKTWEEIRKFLFKSKTISNGAKWEDVRNRFQEVAARVAAGEIDLEASTEYEKAIAQIDKYIGRTDRLINPKKKSNSNTKTEKILVIGDNHIPYTDWERFWLAIDSGVEAGCDVLVINGDFCNGDRLSTHAKFKHEDFKAEIAQGRTVLETLCEKFAKIYLLDDNHIGDRWRRFLGNVVSPDLHFLMMHPYDYMCNGLTNVVRANSLHKNFPDELGHFMIVGDVMFSHAFVSGSDGESVRKVSDWYDKWKSTLSLPDVNAFVHGHTHCLTVNHRPNKVHIQSGTTASLEGLKYSLDGYIKGSPPVYGYTILTLVDGKLDQSEIRQVKM